MQCSDRMHLKFRKRQSWALLSRKSFKLTDCWSKGWHSLQNDIDFQTWYRFWKMMRLRKTQGNVKYIGLFFHQYFKHMRGKTDQFYITLEKVYTWVGRRINKHHHNFCVFVIAQSHQTFVWACFLKCENNTIELPISSVSLTIEN